MLLTLPMDMPISFVSEQVLVIVYLGHAIYVTLWWKSLHPTHTILLTIGCLQVDMVVEIRSENGDYQHIAPHLKVCKPAWGVDNLLCTSRKRMRNSSILFKSLVELLHHHTGEKECWLRCIDTKFAHNLSHLPNQSTGDISSFASVWWGE